VDINTPEKSDEWYLAREVLQDRFDMDDKNFDKMFAKWEAHPLNVARSHKTWPIWVDSVFCSYGVSPQNTAWKKWSRSIEDTQQLLRGELPDQWLLNLESTPGMVSHRDRLIRRCIRWADVERDTLEWNLEHFDDFATKKANQRLRYFWLLTVLSLSPGYVSTVETLKTEESRRLAVALLASLDEEGIWSWKTTEANLECLSKGHLPSGWKQKAPPHMFQSLLASASTRIALDKVITEEVEAFETTGHTALVRREEHCRVIVPAPVRGLSEAQHMLRRTGVTATDISALAGVNPWRTAFQVWCSKVDPLQPTESTPDQVRGTVLEEPVLRMYLLDNPGECRVWDTIVSPRDARMISTPDATVDRRVVELKTTSLKWDDVPISYVYQVHWQWGVLSDMGFDPELTAHIAVLSPWGRFVPDVWDIEIDVDYLGQMREMAAKFWRDHVETGIPPEVGPDDGRALADWRPYHSNQLEYLQADDEAERLMTMLPKFLAARQASEEAIEKIYSKFKVMLDEHPGVHFMNGHKMTWKRGKDSPRTKWKAVVEELKKIVLTMAPNVGETVINELVEKHTTIQEGSRTWRPNAKKLLTE